jgi:FAD synthase
MNGKIFATILLPRSGVYTVRLRVTDNNGEASVARRIGKEMHVARNLKNLEK